MRASVVLVSAQVRLDAGPHRRVRGAGLEKRRRERLERIVPVVVAGNRVDRLGDALEGQPELRLVVLHRPDRVDDVGGDDDEAHVGMVGRRSAAESRRMCCDASPSPVSPMTMNEKSPALSTPAGRTAKGTGCPRTVSSASTARTMASRQVSVRDSAHEFHMPAAQFSVSKYQLMPQTGAVAAMTAASGSPICKAWLRAARTE